jgi:hypothetical protein
MTGVEEAHSLVNEAGAHCSHSKKNQPGKVPLESARGTADDFLSLVPCCSHYIKKKNRRNCG